MKLDHHLQAKILNKLRSSEVPLSYGELKPDELVNSHFSYHLNKLISSGMVVKDSDNYVLSVEGARWINDNGLKLNRDVESRVDVALVVHNDGRYLIAERKGQLKARINDYMLPGAKYSNTNLEEQCHEVAARYIPSDKLQELTQHGFVQLEITYTDKTINRLIYLVRCEVSYFEPFDKEALSSSWLSLDDLSSIDHPSIPTLLKAIKITEDTVETKALILKNI